MATTAPSTIDIDRTSHITLTWPDGITQRFTLTEVRASCPCAECRGLRDRGDRVGPAPDSTPPLTIISAEQVGAWGISLSWSDGHATGIYSWDLLRAWSLTAQGIVEE